MRYINGQTPEPLTPVQRYECKHCRERFDEMHDTFMHIKTEHGIDPFEPIPYPPIERKGAA